MMRHDQMLRNLAAPMASTPLAAAILEIKGAFMETISTWILKPPTLLMQGKYWIYIASTLEFKRFGTLCTYFFQWHLLLVAVSTVEPERMGRTLSSGAAMDPASNTWSVLVMAQRGSQHLWSLTLGPKGSRGEQEKERQKETVKQRIGAPDLWVLECSIGSASRNVLYKLSNSS